MNLSDLQSELLQIKERNQRVEIEKAWETSKTRKILIAILTYATVVIFLYFNQVPNPFLNAIIPTLGFIFSTLSINSVKKLWIKKFHNK